MRVTANSFTNSLSDQLRVLSLRQYRLQNQAATGRRIDLLSLDACLMGMVEVAYEVRSAADVMVGSEELEPGDGWEYQDFLDKLVATPGMDAKTLAGHIVDAYQTRYGAASGETLSAVDLSRIGSGSSGLAGALNGFATYMLDSATGDDWSAVRDAHDASQAFGQQWKDDFHYYDVGDWMTRVAAASVTPAVAAAARDVNTALQQSVFKEYHGSGVTAYGLSIYAPFAKLHPNYTDDIAFVADTRWEEFVSALGIDVVEVVDRSASMDSPGKIDVCLDI